jgi:hypothetical protein
MSLIYSPNVYPVLWNNAEMISITCRWHGSYGFTTGIEALSLGMQTDLKYAEHRLGQLKGENSNKC